MTVGNIVDYNYLYVHIVTPNSGTSANKGIIHIKWTKYKKYQYTFSSKM